MTRRPHETPARHGRRRLAFAGLVVAFALLLSGCSPVEERGYLPKGVTSLSPEITSFWKTTWLWALGMGVLVWGLIIYCMVRYRRKKTDTGLPPQLAYNVPIEILYTVVPVIMVAVLFGKTVQLENKMLDTTSQKNQVVVNVVGKQWSWDFNYVHEEVYDAGAQAEVSRDTGVLEGSLPTLYLPVNERVEFILTSRDVIHSFWVIPFLQKMDMIPGKVNKFAVTPTEIGTFQGKCAELCGAYHSQMLFEVKVVSKANYEKHIQSLRQRGDIGFLSNALSRSSLEPDQQQYLPPNIQKSEIVEGK
ncbi:cytochrome c oxidase subunit II [Leekyejoonella antrihumi]|uniref:Cytochrome c oxidase subunit 2 n=2 Tax=Leekyejoonella antrihumi TaxID=1660198 RepID=A0A563E5B2_9MICO|nr:cytochrome c oxidase subunit II [Leekyejoonella antrihumi]